MRQTGGGRRLAGHLRLVATLALGHGQDALLLRLAGLVLDAGLRLRLGQHLLRWRLLRLVLMLLLLLRRRSLLLRSRLLLVMRMMVLGTANGGCGGGMMATAGILRVVVTYGYAWNY